MKKFFTKIKKAFSAGVNAWKQPEFNPPAISPREEPIARGNVQVMPENEPRGIPPRNFQQQLINNEFAAETCTQEQEGVQVFGTVSGGAIPGSYSRESFTEDGLVSNKTNALMTSAEGRLIKPDELHGGGRCCICGMLTSELKFCAVCKRTLCSRCCLFYKELIVCPEHYKHLEFHDDTWGIRK